MVEDGIKTVTKIPDIKRRTDTMTTTINKNLNNHKNIMNHEKMKEGMILI